MVAHSALHFVVDDTFVHKFRSRVIRHFELQTVAFLEKVVIVQIWEKGTVSVHREKVSEVLGVLTRERVHSEVAASPCIHIGVETAFEHVKEGVSYGVVSASTESQMLQDVRFTRVVVRRRSEQDSKHVIHIRTVHVDPLSAGF